MTCLGMELYVSTIKYEEITFNNWHFGGALSIKSSTRKLNSYISDSLLTLCRREMSDLSILVLCVKPILKKKMSVIHISGHGEFLDLHRIDLLGGFLFLNTTFSFAGQHPAVCCSSFLQMKMVPWLRRKQSYSMNYVPDVYDPR